MGFGIGKCGIYNKFSKNACSKDDIGNFLFWANFIVSVSIKSNAFN